MIEARAATTLFGGVALLERAVAYALGQFQAVSAAALPRATPCQGWDLGALLVHIDDSLATMQEALALRSVDPEPADPSAGDTAKSLVTGLRTRGCQLLGALAGGDDNLVWVGGLPVPMRIVTSAGAIDVAVHGWDVGRACGTGGAMPEDLAKDMLSIAPLLITGADRPGRFSSPIPVLTGASACDRLLAFLGRDPRWHRHHPAAPR
ncbi:MAG: TIGR03086 family metal-binding protein [Streptosporangiaceae bacterium]